MINIYPINSGHIRIEISDTFRPEEAERLADSIREVARDVKTVKGMK